VRSRTSGAIADLTEGMAAKKMRIRRLPIIESASSISTVVFGITSIRCEVFERTDIDDMSEEVYIVY
jgi:hypothetical protein